jgi:hypothetical protein
LDEIVSAARAMLDEFKRQHPDEAGEVVNLDFADESQQDLGSLDNLENALPTIELGEVAGLWIGVSTGLAEFAARIVVGPHGLCANAEGSEAFASGMVAILKSRLAGGAEAGEQAAAVPLRFIDWLLLALIPASFIGSQVLLYSQFGHDDTLWFLFMGLLIAMPAALIFGFVFTDGQDKRSPPRFVLVPEGEQFSDEGELRTGPVWTAKAWFERHPLVAVATLLAVGALLGRAADLIKF